MKEKLSNLSDLLTKQWRFGFNHYFLIFVLKPNSEY